MKKNIVLMFCLLPLFMMACNLMSQPAIERDRPKIIEQPPPVEEGVEPAAATQEKAVQVTYTRWQEPQSAAFAANVPANWIVNGGVSQTIGFHYPWLEVAEAEGRAAFIYGARDWQMYLLPHEQLAQAGYPEGSVVEENEARFLVAAYQYGEDAAENAVRAWVAPICVDPTIDYAQTLSTSVTEEYESSEGVVGFRCWVDGNLMVGEYTVATYKLVDPISGAGIWFTGNRSGFISLESFKEQSREALATMRTSLTLNPQWYAALTPVPGLVGIYFSVPVESAASPFPFVEDRFDDFCARYGGC